jgi:tetratricopeptide (TPR) repeat protein
VPTSDFAHFFVGQENLFLAQTDSDEADAYLAAAEAAFERAPENARAQIGLGGVYFVRAQRRLNAARANDCDGNGAGVLGQVQREAEQALARFDGVVDGGSQVERYGVPVDHIARLGQGISWRLLAEVACYQGDSEQAGKHIGAAISSLETALPALEAVGDQRLLAQAYQALGLVYEWHGFLLEQEENEDGADAARRQARHYYGRCLQLGDDFPFDTYMVTEIVEKLCRPRYELLPAP